MKKISVITPVYNRRDCVAKCLDSVLSQSAPEGWEFEQVIVDDASTDDTITILNDYANKYSNLKIGLLAQNSGPNAARNRAITMADGQWIVQLDSDDQFIDGAIETICNNIDANPGFIHYLFSISNYTERNRQLGKRKVLTFEDFLLNRVSGDFSHVLRRETMLKFPFDEKLRVFEGIFYLNFYREAKNILYLSIETTVVDLGRNDHVTAQMHLSSNKAIKAKFTALDLKIRLFEDEFMKSDEGAMILSDIYNNNFKLATLLGDYNSAKKCLYHLDRKGRNPGIAWRCIYSTRMGRPASILLKALIKLKHLRHNR